MRALLILILAGFIVAVYGFAAFAGCHVYDRDHVRPQRDESISRFYHNLRVGMPIADVVERSLELPSKPWLGGISYKCVDDPGAGESLLRSSMHWSSASPDEPPDYSSCGLVDIWVVAHTVGTVHPYVTRIFVEDGRVRYISPLCGGGYTLSPNPSTNLHRHPSAPPMDTPAVVVLESMCDSAGEWPGSIWTKAWADEQALKLERTSTR